MNDIQAKQLAAAVSKWLDFQILCKRDMLLSENYLAQPVGEFLRAIHASGIRSEWNHPNFNNAKRGRPRQIDYVLTSRNKDRPISAIETKWIGSQNTDKQRIINDLMRLECIRNKENQGMTRYFLIAGITPNVDKYFFQLAMNSGAGPRELFCEKIFCGKIDAEKIIHVKQAERLLKLYFKDFSESYNIEIPTSFKTKLIADTQSENVRVVVWKVFSTKRRTTFNPIQLWTGVVVPDNE